MSLVSIDSYFYMSFLGNIYFAEYSNHRIRKVTISTGIITTIAGNGGTGSFSGDNGEATAAALNQPFGVEVDSSGTFITILFILSPLTSMLFT